MSSRTRTLLISVIALFVLVGLLIAVLLLPGVSTNKDRKSVV